MDEIIGTWRLIDEDAWDQDGEPLPTLFGSNPMGLVVFTSVSRMMVGIADGTPPDPIDGTRNHLFYYGSFTFDGHRLVTTVEGCSDAIWRESPQVRDVRFDGDRLKISPPVGLLGPLDVRRELTWERIA